MVLRSQSAVVCCESFRALWRKGMSKSTPLKTQSDFARLVEGLDELLLKKTQVLRLARPCGSPAVQPRRVETFFEGEHLSQCRHGRPEQSQGRC